MSSPGSHPIKEHIDDTEDFPKIEENLEVVLETTLSPSTVASDDDSETESVTVVERIDALPNQIELGDYLYNQEDDKDYEGDYFYDFGNSPFAKSVDEMIQGFWSLEIYCFNYYIVTLVLITIGLT